MVPVTTTRISELEQVIERGMQTFVEVGIALEEIREGKLYREQGFETFEVYCKERWGWARSHAYNYISAAAVFKNVQLIGQSEPSLTQAIQLARISPELQRRVAEATDFSETTVRELRAEVRQLMALCGTGELAVPLHPSGVFAEARLVPCVPMAAPEVQSEVPEFSREANLELGSAIKSSERLAIHYASDSCEWYTPPEIIERSIRALGGVIDLDPCSNEGSPTIPAGRCFTKADDGLSKPWAGRVYMNPPYGREIPEWAAKLHREYCEGEVTHAIALVPARVDTDWFRLFRDYAICFIDGRLKFSGHENSAPFPSAVIYLGHDIARFFDAFADMGDIWMRWEKEGYGLPPTI